MGGELEVADVLATAGVVVALLGVVVTPWLTSRLSAASSVQRLDAIARSLSLAEAFAASADRVDAAAEVGEAAREVCLRQSASFDADARVRAHVYLAARERLRSVFVGGLALMAGALSLGAGLFLLGTREGFTGPVVLVIGYGLVVFGAVAFTRAWDAAKSRTAAAATTSRARGGVPRAPRGRLSDGQEV